MSQLMQEINQHISVIHRTFTGRRSPAVADLSLARHHPQVKNDDFELSVDATSSHHSIEK